MIMMIMMMMMMMITRRTVHCLEMQICADVLRTRRRS